MKKILIMGLMLCLFQAKAQETPLQQLIKAIPQNQFHKQELFKTSLKTEPANQTISYPQNYDLLEVDNRILDRIVNDKRPAIEIEISIKGIPFNLQLIRNEKMFNNSMIFKTESGIVSFKAGVYYYGVIKRQPNSLVAISFFNNNIMGIISTVNGDYVLGKNNSKDLLNTEYRIYKDKDLQAKYNEKCGITKTSKNSKSNSTISSITGTPVKCVSLYIETDYHLYQKLGNSTYNVGLYITAAINALTAIFFNESIPLTTITPFMWTSTDPYGSGTSIFDIENTFHTLVGTGFGADLATLFSGRTGLNFAGVGSGLLCGDKRVSVSSTLGSGYLAPTFYSPLSSEIALIAHEIGHTFGSGHTHWCLWGNGNNAAIDACSPTVCNNPGFPPLGGTIMSYCNLIDGVGIKLANGFGIEPGNLIRARVASGNCLATCNTTCQSDVIIRGTDYIDTYYTMPLTESSTWIKTEGQTLVKGGSVKLDSDSSSYVELNPGFETKADSLSVFVAKAYNGCTTGAPSFTSSNRKYSSNPNDFFSHNEKSYSFLVYPNPAIDYFFLTSNLDLNNSKIELFDINGRSQKTLIQSISNKSKKIMVNNLSKGMYLIKLTSTAKTEFGKIIIL